MLVITIAHFISKFGFKVIEDFTESMYNLALIRTFILLSKYSHLPNKRVGCNKRAGLYFSKKNNKRAVIKGTSQPGLRLVPSGNFFLVLNRSHHFLLKKVRI